MLLAATVLLVVRNAALVDAPSAGWTHGSPWIWTHFQRYEPEPEPDPIGFLWPPAQLELSVPSAAEAPSTAVKLTLASEHYRPMRDGARVLQVDENPPMALESSRPERLTLELQGLAAGMHTARAWLQSGPPAAATRIDFEVPAADGDAPPLPPPEPPPPEPEPSPPPPAGTPERCAWDPPPAPEPVAAPPEAPPPVDRGAPVVDGQPSFVLDAEHRAAAGELLRLRHPATEQGLTAMHAALLPWDTSPTRTFLLTVRVSNTSDGGGAKDGRAGSSAVNYALLDAELNPLTPFRLLELRSPRTRQRRSGPEDARLVRVGGRRFLLYNDAYDDAPGGDAEGGLAHLARPWVMRRRMYLAELVAEPPAAPKRRRAARRLPPEEEILEEEEEEEEEGGGGDEAMTAGVRALEPVALVADDAVFGAAGRRSVVEKNWVPWALNGSLYMSYSLDPHIVLRVPLPPASAAASAAPATVDVTLTHATRFARPPAENAAAEAAAAAGRPELRGGTPAVRIDRSTFLAFLHSVQRRGGRSVYRVAAYTFDAAPPFAVTAISPPFALGRHALPYPIGVHATKRHLYLSYGASDAAWFVAKLDRAALLATLIPVHTEAAPRAAAGAAPPPVSWHVFSSAPAEVREALTACASGTAAAGSECEELRAGLS